MGATVGKITLVGAALATSFIPGVGQALTAGLASTGLLSGAAVTSVVSGISTLALTAGLQAGASLAGVGPKAPKASTAQLSRLAPSVDPGTPRKLVVGNTAMPVDIRYVEPSGADQGFVDYVVCCAAHKATATAIWFEDRLAWTSASGVDAFYAGYLTVDAINEAGASAYHTVNDGSKWGASERLTGCSTLRLRIKRTGADKKADSPLVNGLPSRVTIIGEGMPTYDPRQDSTAGGDGAQRANDRATWVYAGGQGENPALQILSYLLGWTINGRLSVGKGIPASRLDLASFITAANLCDEDVSLAAGGTQPRYRTHGVFSEADSPTAVLQALCASCNGTLRDANGRLRLDILHNDLSSYFDLDDDDILGDFTWEQTPSIEAFPNIIRGKFTDPSDNALFQMVDYPEVALSSIDGIDRIVTLDLPLVQDSARAQRIAKQALQRMQYPGVFRAEFTAKAWAVQVGSVVRLTFSALGFSNKLFRVVEQTIQLNGVCAMTLREENSAIYAWDAEDGAAVTAAAPTVYDPANSPLVQAARQEPFVKSSTRPAGAYYGQGWLDDNNYLHVNHGYDVSYNGTVVTFSGDQASMPWVQTRDSIVEVVESLSVSLAGKADASAVTTLAGRVTTAEGAITAQASSIADLDAALAGKASASALSALDTRVTTAEGAITSIASDVTTLEADLAGKASASALSSLDSRVTTAEGTITSQASALTSLTSTVGDNSSNITFLLSANNGDEANVVLQTNVAGRLTGMKFDGAAGDIDFQAENVFFRDAGGDLVLGIESGEIVFYGNVRGSVDGVPAAEIAAAATTGGVQSAAITALGASPELYFVLDDGASRLVEAEFLYGSMSGPSSIELKVQRSVDGGSWVDLDSDSATGTVGEPVSLSASGAYTNTSGVREAVRFRAFTTSSAGAVGTVGPASFVRA